MILGERPTQVASEFVIRGSTVLLAILTGTGAAFGLWSQLQHTAAPGLLTASVAALCLGAALVGVAIRNFGTRLFLVIAALSLAVAFFAGSGAFAALTA